MVIEVQNLLEEELTWEKNADPEYPFVADFDGETYMIRLNNFPEENLYTLIVGGKEVTSFDDWPERWIQLQPQVAAYSRRP